MLQRIKNALIDPTEVAAVEIDEICQDWAHIILRSGTTIDIEASEDRILEWLSEAGLLHSMTGLPDEAIALEEEEEDELRHLYAIGCTYIARDKDGKAYAYAERPELHGAYWEVDGGEARQLGCDYDFLEAGGEKPLEILALLAGIC